MVARPRGNWETWGIWWDFRHHADGLMTCIVQTGHPNDNTDFIAEFSGDEDGVAKAENLIGQIKRGQVDVLKMIRKGKQ